MYEHAVVQLRTLATSPDPAEVARYRAICGYRDTILADVVVTIAKAILDHSGYRPDPAAEPIDNYRRALDVIEHHLAQSSLPLSEQQLLALIGIDALAGWTVQLEDEDHETQVIKSGAGVLDPIVTHRVARALDRSPDQEPGLWLRIQASAESAPEETTLVLAAVRVLLDEIPMNELDNAVGTMVVDSILGG